MVEARVTALERQIEPASSASSDRAPRLGIELVAVYAIAAALLAWASVRLGKDVNWDLQNYHAYAPWALLNGGYARDVLAGNWQAYLNPIVLLVRYPLVTFLPPVAAGAALAGIQALNLPVLYAIASRLFDRDSRAVRVALAALATVLGGLSANFLSQIGTSFSDVLLSIPTLGALLLLMPRPRDLGARAVTRRLALAGLFVGLSVGLKLPNYFLAIAIVLTAMVGWTSWPQRLRAAAVVAMGAAVGAAAAALPWALRMQSEFGNPFFPLYGSGETALQYARDLRVKSSVIGHAFERLTTWVTSGGPDADSTDLRATMLAALALVSCIAPLLGRPSRAGEARLDEGRFGAFFVSGLVLWILVGGVDRHAVPLHLLIGPAIVVCCRCLLAGRLAVACAALLVVASFLTVQPPDRGRQAWSRSWFDVQPSSALPLGATYVLIPRGGPLGFLPEAFPAGSVFVQGTFSRFVPRGSVLDQRARAVIEDGPPDRTFAIVNAPPDGRALRCVKGLGLGFAVPCLPFHTGVGPMVACPLVRRPRGGDRGAPLLSPGAWTSPGWPGDGSLVVDEGWSHPESWGRWAVGPRSTLHFKSTVPGPTVLEVLGYGFVGAAMPPLEIGVYVDGRHATDWHFAGERDRAETTRTVCLPAGASDDRIAVELRADSPRSPASVGQGPDDRPLTMGIHALRVRAAAAGECPDRDDFVAFQWWSRRDRAAETLRARNRPSAPGSQRSVPTRLVGLRAP